MTPDWKIALWEALSMLLRSNLPLAETEKWAEHPSVREALKDHEPPPNS